MRTHPIQHIEFYMKNTFCHRYTEYRNDVKLVTDTFDNYNTIIFTFRTTEFLLILGECYELDRFG